MSEYGATQAIITRLREIPVLAEATIVEDYTSPQTKRPVLTPVVSVGVKSMEMVPTDRLKHTVNTVMRLTMLFPSGLTGETTSSDIVYRTSAAFVGRVFQYLLVESVTVNKPVFDTSLYGVGIELELHMKGVFTMKDPLETDPDETYTIGGVTFDRFPQQVSVSRSMTASASMTNSPRVFTLEGNSYQSVGGSLWSSLHTLMNSNTALSFSLPRSEQTVSVKPTSIETEGETCGYGFTYRLVFTEVL